MHAVGTDRDGDGRVVVDDEQCVTHRRKTCERSRLRDAQRRVRTLVAVLDDGCAAADRRVHLAHEQRRVGDVRRDRVQAGDAGRPRIGHQCVPRASARRGGSGSDATDSDGASASALSCSRASCSSRAQNKRSGRCWPMPGRYARSSACHV